MSIVDAAIVALVGLNLLVLALLVVVLRRVGGRATTGSVAALSRRLDELAVRTAADAAANQREALAAIDQLAEGRRHETPEVPG